MDTEMGYFANKMIMPEDWLENFMFGLSVSSQWAYTAQYGDLSVYRCL